MSLNIEGKNVVLILGNGFDLHCHCKTSYVDFYNYLNHYPAYQNIFSLCDSYVESESYQNREEIVNGAFASKELPIWTIYFYCVNKKDVNKTGNWYDIENYLREFLINRIDGLVAYLCFDIPGLEDYSYLTLLLGDIIRMRYPKIDWNNDKSAKQTLCDLLLEDLKNFELGFASYVSKNYDRIRLYEIERERLLKQIKDFIGYNNAIKICTFNYTHIPSEKEDDVFNIHGTCTNPILGIDYIGENDTEISIFTKVVRQRDDETIPVPDEFFGDKQYILIFYGLSFCQTDVDDIRTISSYRSDDSDIYILYNKFYINDVEYNPRNDLIISFRDFVKKVGFYNITTDKDFDKFRRDGNIVFKEVK